MAITEREFIEPVSDFIFGVTNERPFPAKENIPLPDNDFMSVEVVSANAVSWTTTGERFLTVEGLPESYTQYITMIRVTGYGNQAFSWLHTIADSLRDSNVKQALKTAGIAYQEHTEIRDASVAIDNTKIEKRYTMLIQFSYISGGVTSSGQADCIDTVQPPTFIGDYIT